MSNIQEELVKLLNQMEGCRLTPYLCPAGYPTIAAGATFYPENNIKVKMSDPTITEQRADEITGKLAKLFMAATLSMSPILAGHPNVLIGVTDFVFNLGATRYKSSTFKRRIDAGDWHGAYVECQKWVNGGGRKLPGLVKRRKIDGAYILM